ncbi:hypothetical protein GCM10025868_26870 [Angustibacter aerolatus]|uniref:NADP-dependent oxidoreductase domain-containing protein n=1 Tax=Angustibacter aerolatus TaxID=1162965 RepID=A0ABQ6JKQ7_9ACTN|nr:aldo/keto reductase [Angustibacter aerolatus]GMA87437.1 hypothetical protein GCM10025868_26870 [Angustibacter aerolatus]
MQTRTLGTATVSAIGLGGMPMSIEGRPDRDRSLRTIHAALDAGVTLIDTADAYHRDADEVGHNEALIAEALRTWGGDASSVLVATKGGHTRPGNGDWLTDGRPEHLKEAAKASAQRLGVEAIGLYQFHRPDPEVPYAESVGALAEPARRRRDRPGRHLEREPGADPAGAGDPRWPAGERAEPVLARLPQQPGRGSTCAPSLGIAFLPWSPLGGIGKGGDLDDTAFAEVAEAHGVSPQQVALAWEPALAPVVVPIPGSSRPETIQDSVQAADLTLTDDEIARLSATSDPSSTRSWQPPPPGPRWLPRSCRPQCTGQDGGVVEMTDAEFDEAVRRALDLVPAELTAQMDNVVVLVEAEPPSDEPDDLLGLYDGTPLTERDAGWGVLRLPDRITIFRGPTLRMCDDVPDVVEEVAVTVVHEIAHHFGIDDERLHDLGWG